MSKRTFFIGDVHGCYDELLSLVGKIWLTPEDHLYFVGDLINKWPKSLEVIEFIRNRPNTWSVIGNHEYFILTTDESIIQVRIERENSSWLSSLREKTANFSVLFEWTDHREWLLALPHIIERDDFILVHGGLHPDYGLSTPIEIATMIRVLDGRPWYESYTGVKPVIYGHWATDGLRIRSNTIGLDTGCCFGGHLTWYCLETGEYWQSRANAVYKEPSNWKR